MKVLEMLLPAVGVASVWLAEEWFLQYLVEVYKQMIILTAPNCYWLRQ
jgi:hypothetical protein